MKKLRIVRILLIGICFHVMSANVLGQAYRMELGILGGNSFYMGDANQNVLFKNRRVSYGALARYHINERFSIKANALVAGISGTTQGQSSAYLNGAEVNFSRSLFDAGAQLEVNFYEYGAPEYQPGASRISPYLFVGAGLTGYKADKNKLCFNMPFGLGVKVKVAPRINLGCEWSFRKTVADDLDYVNSATGFQLQDSWSGIGSGNKNKDWYSIWMVYVSYDLYGIGSKCFR